MSYFRLAVSTAAFWVSRYGLPAALAATILTALLASDRGDLIALLRWFGEPGSFSLWPA